MNDDTVRVGLVSSVNQDTGMVRVTYPDRDREVTPELPFFKMGNEYQMPRSTTWSLSFISAMTVPWEL